MFKTAAAQVTFSDSFLYLAIVLDITITTLVIVFSWRWWQQNTIYKALYPRSSPFKHWLLGNIPQVLAAVK